MREFKDIYDDFYGRSFRFVKSYVFDDMVTEDIVSESLLSLWQQMRQHEVSHPLSLLLTILKHKSLNYLKEEERKQRALTSLADVKTRDLHYRVNTLEACDPQEIFSAEVTEIITQTLATLSPQSREVFELSRYGQKSTREIAETMNLSTKAVEYHMTKVLKLLRMALKDYLPAYLLLML